MNSNDRGQWGDLDDSDLNELADQLLQVCRSRSRLRLKAAEILWDIELSRRLPNRRLQMEYFERKHGKQQRIQIESEAQMRHSLLKYINPHSGVFQIGAVIIGLFLTLLLPETQSLFAAITWLTGCAVFMAPPLIRNLFYHIETYHHEVGHALAAILTSGRCGSFSVHKDGGGCCTTAGGRRELILSAGYTFGMILGGIFILRSLFGRISEPELLALGFLYLISLVKANDAHTILIGISLVLLATAPAVIGNQLLMRAALNSLGVVLILTGFQSQMILHKVSMRSGQSGSDAEKMRDLHGGHPLLWSLLFSGIGILVVLAIGLVVFKI